MAVNVTTKEMVEQEILVKKVATVISIYGDSAAKMLIGDCNISVQSVGMKENGVQLSIPNPCAHIKVLEHASDIIHYKGETGDDKTISIPELIRVITGLVEHVWVIEANPQS
jgi:hypothetical protein